MKLGKSFVKNIRALIIGARDTVARGVDLVQVHTNFEIGRRIVEQEQKGKGRAAYGQMVIKALSERLSEEFGRGFSPSNLASMRTFFLLYRDCLPIFQSVTGKSADDESTQPATARSSVPAILQSVTGKSIEGDPPLARPFALSWTHYVLLLGIGDPDERRFYEIESAAQDWTVRELRRQFDSSLYERLALSRNKAGIRRLATEGQRITRPEDLLKEPLVLEFLGLEEAEPLHRIRSRDRRHQPDRAVPA